MIAFFQFIFHMQDVTAWAGKHPGGAGRIHDMCGKNGTKIFDNQHGSSNEGWLDTYTTYMGNFNGSALPTATTGSSFCFSSVATVQVQGKGATSMKDLNVGDKILTGNQVYQTVYAFAHREHTKTIDFIQLHSKEHGMPLEISREHLVFLAGKTNPVRADWVEVGDILQSGDHRGVEVSKITSIARQGLYAPLTLDGTLVVNGIKASSYISLQKNAPEYVQLQNGVQAMSQHNLIHLALSPFRMVCMGLSSNLCQMNEKDGMPSMVYWGIQVAQWLDGLDLNLAVQVFLLGIFVSIFGGFAFVEAAVRSAYSYGPVAMVIAGLLWTVSAKLFQIRVPGKTKAV